MTDTIWQSLKSDPAGCISALIAIALVGYILRPRRVYRPSVHVIPIPASVFANETEEAIYYDLEGRIAFGVWAGLTDEDLEIYRRLRYKIVSADPRKNAETWREYLTLRNQYERSK